MILPWPFSEPVKQHLGSETKGIQPVCQTSKAPSQFPTPTRVGDQLSWFAQNSPSFTTDSLLFHETAQSQANQTKLVILHRRQPGMSPPYEAF